MPNKLYFDFLMLRSVILRQYLNADLHPFIIISYGEINWQIHKLITTSCYLFSCLVYLRTCIALMRARNTQRNSHQTGRQDDQ